MPAAASPPFLLLGLALLASLAAGAQEIDKSRPARVVYRNIQLFVSDRVSAEDLDDLMAEISYDLGVECTHCHIQDAWHRDDLDSAQLAARARIPVMWGLVGGVNTEYFPGAGGPVRCWTCHRGSPAPETAPPSSAEPVLPPDPDPFSSLDRPAAEVYENVEVLGDAPASSLRETMVLFARSLGFICTDCHVEGDWASDEKEQKRTARKMLGMVTEIRETYFEGSGGPTCWTCHRGSNRPVTLRPEDPTPDR